MTLREMDRVLQLMTEGAQCADDRDLFFKLARAKELLSRKLDRAEGG